MQNSRHILLSHLRLPQPGGPGPRIRSHVSAKRNLHCYHWEGCMGSMPCHVEFGYQVSICSETKENHGKSWSSWPVAGPSGCKLTTSQQSGTNTASLNISPYLCCCVFLFFFSPQQVVVLQLFVCAYDLDKHQTVQNKYGRNKRIYEQLCIQICIYL
jgi:hypothetical protein